MELVVTCRRCGTRNRVASTPDGRTAVCGKCRSVLGDVAHEEAPKRSGKLSGVAWAWIMILGIAIVAWLVHDYQTAASQNSTYSHPAPIASPYDAGTGNLPSYSSPERSQRVVSPAFSEPELPLPYHGDVTWYTAGDPVAPLEIRTAPGSHYLVKLSDFNSDRDVLTVFVHGGRVATLDVPLRTYRIKYATGEKWYGLTHLFGPDTSYARADSTFDFRVEGNQVSGYTLTLYKVVNGNLETSSISPEDF